MQSDLPLAVTFILERLEERGAPLKILHLQNRLTGSARLSPFQARIESSDGTPLAQPCLGYASRPDAEEARYLAVIEAFERFVWVDNGRVGGIASGYACHQDEKRAKRAALLELIERDTIIKAWENKIAPKPVTGPSWTATQDQFGHYLQCLEDHGYTLKMYHWTRQLDARSITTCIAVAQHRENVYPAHFVGYGCDEDPLLAALHAVRETSLLWLFDYSAIRDGRIPDTLGSNRLKQFYDPRNSELLDRWFDPNEKSPAFPLLHERNVKYRTWYRPYPVVMQAESDEVQTLYQFRKSVPNGEVYPL